MFRDLEVVQLARDIPAEGLHVGDRGTIVWVYGDGAEAFEVKFMRGDGTTIAVVTLTAADLRPIVP